MDKNTTNNTFDPSKLISIEVPIRAVTTAGHRVKFQADTEVRRKIGRMFEIEALKSFSTKAVLLPWKRDGVQLSGEIHARLTQRCIISLKPVEETIDETFQLRLVPEGSKLAADLAASGEGETLSPDDAELPDVFSGESIDLGPIFLEQFSLALNPFSRAEGEEFTRIADNNADETVHRENPFAVLKALKARE